MTSPQRIVRLFAAYRVKYRICTVDYIVYRVQFEMYDEIG
jgi:hypothetical protein